MTPTCNFVLKRSPGPLTSPLDLRSSELEWSSSSMRLEPTEDSATGSLLSCMQPVGRIDSNFRSDLG
jgi:hypothetical protein